VLALWHYIGVAGKEIQLFLSLPYARVHREENNGSINCSLNFKFRTILGEESSPHTLALRLVWFPSDNFQENGTHAADVNGD